MRKDLQPTYLSTSSWYCDNGLLLLTTHVFWDPQWGICLTGDAVLWLGIRAITTVKENIRSHQESFEQLLEPEDYLPVSRSMTRIHQGITNIPFFSPFTLSYFSRAFLLFFPLLRYKRRSQKQILPDTAFPASFIRSQVSSDQLPLVSTPTSSQSTNVLRKGFLEFVILKHACFNFPRDWFDWLFFCCKKLFRYPCSTFNGPDFTLWDHVLWTRKLESSVIDPESGIREKLISY